MTEAHRIRTGGPDPTGSTETTLVCGHGRDPASAHALAVAVDLARRLHAHLYVVHGVDLADYPIDPDAFDWEQQADRALTEQHRQVDVAMAGAPNGWTYHAARGAPVGLQTVVAAEHDASMIIVGTRGEGFGATMERMLGRSVSYGVIRRQDRPLVVVPPPADGEGQAVGQLRAGSISP